MIAEITNIEQVNHECVKITATVYCPKFGHVELDAYNNLHVGAAELKQEIRLVNVPRVVIKEVMP